MHRNPKAAINVFNYWSRHNWFVESLVIKLGSHNKNVVEFIRAWLHQSMGVFALAADIELGIIGTDSAKAIQLKYVDTAHISIASLMSTDWVLSKK